MSAPRDAKGRPPSLLIALPGGHYFSLPREVLEAHAIPKEAFEASAGGKWKADDSASQAEVVGQSDDGGVLRWLAGSDQESAGSTVNPDSSTGTSE